RLCACKRAGFLVSYILAFLICFRLHLLYISIHSWFLLWFYNLFYKWMFRGQNGICRPKQCVRTRRKDNEFIVIAIDSKGDFRPFRTPDPIALHLFNALWPIEFFQIFQKSIRICRNP